MPSPLERYDRVVAGKVPARFLVSRSVEVELSGEESTGDAEKTLHIFCWSEYIPQQVVDAFSEESGIKVSMETYSSNEEMLAKLLAGGGNYDIIQPSEYVIEGVNRQLNYEASSDELMHLSSASWNGNRQAD